MFSENCAACHRLFGEGDDQGFDLTNLQRGDLGYLIKSIVDPNALVGFDFQPETIVTSDGRVVTGLVRSESEESLVIQTASENVTFPKSGIDSRASSDVSIMPEGLLQKMTNEQVRDLFGYLQGADQASLPPSASVQP
jgi:putative heme-binding domain-containing protein